MKAWIFNQQAKTLQLQDIEQPTPRPGAVLVRMDAVPLLSYTEAYLEGELPYGYPQGDFTPGTNGVGHVLAVGDGVYHLKPGQRVAVHPLWQAPDAVAEPARILIGLTAIDADSGPLQQTFPHGTLREVAEMPASTVLPLDGLGDMSAERLAVLGKFLVPFGGLRRGRLAAGETVAINGASGYFGSAAVLAALAMGAGKVLAVGRRAEALRPLVALGKGRVVAAVLTGDVEHDAAMLREVAGPAGVHMALDMIGQAASADSTLAVLHSLARNGRLVLMGSMNVPLALPYGALMLNNWEIMGNFMYQPEDAQALIALLRGKQLDLSPVTVRSFALAALPEAARAASDMQGLQATVVQLQN
ncbi:zinc-binding alcohol dehydrogenase family protein [Pseudoduganella sp. RAF19]|uniref:quinone oxidoreductase family protein n=3 Tax=unclassified Pseudoduganella TaxID=2637179 RepID=UPI003F94DBC7